MAEPSPLQRYLGVQRITDREMFKLLGEAANEAEALVASLAKKKGIGVTVRQAEYRAISAELRAAQRRMWVTLGVSITDGMNAAGLAAADTENAVTRGLFQSLGGPLRELEIAMQEQARQTVATLQARLDNGISLSQQVYNTSVAANGALQATINKGILLGKSWQEIAQSVSQFIDPATPGGVSYAAQRLSRTELNNAFHRTQIDQRKNDPFVTGMRWHLSGSHPRPDQCNTYAESTHVDGGEPGVFSPTEVPGKPHPQCLCFLTSVPLAEDEFIQGFLDGTFDKHIDDKVYEFAPGQAPC